MTNLQNKIDKMNDTISEKFDTLQNQFTEIKGPLFDTIKKFDGDNCKIVCFKQIL